MRRDESLEMCLFGQGKGRNFYPWTLARNVMISSKLFIGHHQPLAARRLNPGARSSEAVENHHQSWACLVQVAAASATNRTSSEFAWGAGRDALQRFGVDSVAFFKSMDQNKHNPSGLNSFTSRKQASVASKEPNSPFVLSTATAER